MAWPFQGLDDHVIDFIEDAHRHQWSEPLAGLAEQAHGERVHGIAGIHGNWDPRAAMHCRDAAPQVAAVFNIVVHEKCIVQHLQAGGGGKRILAAAAQRPRGRDAQGRAKTLARPVDELLHEPIQVPLRFPRRHAFCQRLGEHAAIPDQSVQEARRAHDIAGGRHGVGGLDQHILQSGHISQAAPRRRRVDDVEQADVPRARRLRGSSVSAMAWPNGATCSSRGRACSRSGDAPRKAWAATCTSEWSHGRPAW